MDHMALGPEWTRLQEEWIRTRALGLHVESADGSEEGVFLSLGGNRRREHWFFSWDPRRCGLCRVLPEERREWLRRSGKTPVIHEALRSHLGGAVLHEVCQWKKDRVLILGFRRVLAAGYAKSYSLVLEGTERQSNVSLVDEKGTILEVARRVYPEVNRYRTLLPGAPYVPPPPLPRDASGGAPEGVGRPLLRYLQERGEEEEGGRLGNLLGERLYAEGAEPLRFLWFALPRGEGLLLLPPEASPVAGEDAFPVCDPLEATRSAVFLPLRDGFLERRRREIRKVLRGRMDALRSQLRPSDDRGEEPAPIQRYRRWGTLLLAEAHRIPPGATVATVTDWEAPETPEIQVPLIPGLSPVETANEYFSKYRKAWSRHQAGLKRQGFLAAELATLEEQEALLESADRAEALEELARDLGVQREVVPKKGPKPPAYRQARVAEAGGTVYLGESARGNRQLTFRTAKPEDWWFHAQGVPGAHVLFRREDGVDGPPEERVLVRVAALAAWYSRGKGSGKVWVDYTQRKHVRSLPDHGIAGARYSIFKSLLVEPKSWETVLRELQGGPAGEGI